MNISPISNNERTFQAKFVPYPNTLTNSEYFKLFEEMTKGYPNLILKQEEISRFGNDYVTLFDGNKKLAHGYFGFMRNHPQDMEGFVNRLKKIFDTLYKNQLPDLHVDYIPPKAKWEA